MSFTIPYVSNRAPVRNNRISDLILRAGQDAAEGQMRSGQIWGNTVGSLGSIAAGAISEHAEQKRKAPIDAAKLKGETTRNELSELQLNETKKQAERRAKREAAMQLPHRQEVLAALSTDPEGQAEAAERFGRMDDYYDSMMGEAAAGVARAGFQPFAFQAALKDLEAKGMDRAKLDEYAAVFESDPEKAKALTYQLLSNSPNAKHQAIFAEAQQSRLKEAEIQAQKDRYIAANALKATDDKRADLTLEETRRHNKAMEANGANTGASFQAKDILDDNGKPVVANYNSKTGQYTGPNGQVIKNPQPIPSDRVAQDQNKFKKAAPAIRAIESLSERINTGSGLLAKMSGGAAKIAAKANYDDDVAEYQSLVSGFTPMVARAVGHTGVLTQQDVDSVKALFPLPGESKTLRDRKVARLNAIMSELETVGAAGADIPKGGDGGWTVVNGIKIREKK